MGLHPRKLRTFEILLTWDRYALECNLVNGSNSRWRAGCVGRAPLEDDAKGGAAERRFWRVSKTRPMGGETSRFIKFPFFRADFRENMGVTPKL